MTLNDFRAVAGARATGIRSLPVVKGTAVAARIACITMALPQAIVVALLLVWGAPLMAGIVALSLALQTLCMRRLLRDPEGQALWYNATGVSLYVTGVMLAAMAIRGM